VPLRRRYDAVVEILWSHRVEGDSFRWLVIESDRALVSTARQTLVVSRTGEFLDRYPTPEPVRHDIDSSVRLGKNRYELSDGYLTEFGAKGSQARRVEIQRDQFERHRESFVRQFGDGTPAAAAFIDQRIRDWWRSTYLVADSGRGRLLAIGGNVPWLTAVRIDGGVVWALLIGSPTDCCNSAEIVADDGTLAHFSSCGRRITFVAEDGEVVSTHTIDGPSSGRLLTNRRGVAYVTIINEGIHAYRPTTGRTNTVEIPGMQHAELKDGTLYVVRKDSSDACVVQAIREPA
jgi:hypothetical protein